MSAERPELTALAKQHPDAYRQLLADAEDLGLEVLAEPMREALADAEDGGG